MSFHTLIPEELEIENKEDKKGKEFIFSYGHKVESLVIETFCNITGAKVIPETRMFRKKSMPYITANIDAIVEMPDGRKQQRFSIRVLGKITKFLYSICHNADNTCLFLMILRLQEHISAVFTEIR